MQEDGMNSGFRNVGRFALAAIPWILGLAALVWLSVWVGVHEYRREIAQENRAATYTGNESRPQEKLKIEVMPHDCTKVIRVDVDGDEIMIYARSDCHENLDYTAYHWEEVSVNGTTIKTGYENGASCPILTHPGSLTECKAHMEVDDRAVKIIVWTSKNTH